MKSWRLLNFSCISEGSLRLKTCTGTHRFHWTASSCCVLKSITLVGYDCDDLAKYIVIVRAAECTTCCALRWKFCAQKYTLKLCWSFIGALCYGGGTFNTQRYYVQKFHIKLKEFMKINWKAIKLRFIKKRRSSYTSLLAKIDIYSHKVRPDKLV